MSVPFAGRNQSLPARTSPAWRELHIFSLDPSADIQLDTALISRVVLSIPWEDLRPGPIGEYVEVVDVDPASGYVYSPVDLDEASVLARRGEPPSTGNPHFHQQMVYCVAMKTIGNFERVLGREILWSEREITEEGTPISDARKRFVRRLRIYPHALRERNAFYSPSRKALLFGYYNAPASDPRDELPGGLVFTCLSHDIIAHETTHAIVDGLHRRMLDASNLDMLAFHEAFADTVAIFQHFTLPGLLADQIQRTRGDLQQNNLLARLAIQFARSSGDGNALRNALGTFGTDGKRRRGEPGDLAVASKPHDRGAILVAAIFDAFLRIYEDRVADLRRIATGGTGRLPEGDIQPDLAKRFANEAMLASQRVLDICIRALDYLPPVDITFGDFLRAVTTADIDFVAEDVNRHRLAFIEAFRDRGIYPLDVRTLAEDSLRWTSLTDAEWITISQVLPPANVLRTMACAYETPDGLLAADNDPGRISRHLQNADLDLACEEFLKAAWLGGGQEVRPEGGPRYARYLRERSFATFLHHWFLQRVQGLSDREQELINRHLGIDPSGLSASTPDDGLEAHTVRPTMRLRADGSSKTELMVMLTQRRWEWLADSDGNPRVAANGKPLGFWFLGGCTLIIDPERARIRYAISKSMSSDQRLGRHREFLRCQLAMHGDQAAADLGLRENRDAAPHLQEPFLNLHATNEQVGGY